MAFVAGLVEVVAHCKFALVSVPVRVVGHLVVGAQVGVGKHFGMALAFEFEFFHRQLGRKLEVGWVVAGKLVGQL